MLALLIFGFASAAIIDAAAGPGYQDWRRNEVTDRTDCGINEELITARNCRPSSCPGSCRNPIPDSCQRKCLTGCQCKRGYLREGMGADFFGGRCVNPRVCRPKGPCHKEVLGYLSRGRPSDLTLPFCTLDGRYRLKQCQEWPEVMCWCVDPDTGTMIEGTHKRLADGPVHCTGKPGKALSCPEDKHPKYCRDVHSKYPTRSCKWNTFKEACPRTCCRVK